jgi:DNA-binding response OmpR family regulator
MKGMVRVESVPGSGTSFHIVIPASFSTDLAVPANSTKETNAVFYETGNEGQPGREHAHVLLVDDNEDIRLFIRTCLGNAYRFIEAQHGREGLSMAIERIPDLIISDLMMPDMDGIEFCRHIKNDKRTDHIPFIILTAKATEQSKLEGLTTGADDYLIKPFNKNELLAKVKNRVELQQNLQSHLRHELLMSGTPVHATSAEEQFILKAKVYVEKYMAESSLTVESLAAEMSLSREQLYRKMIALTSLSPSLFIRQLRLQKAARLVAAKWGPVSQIAYEVGYENLSHFSKSFKEEFGTLPSEYKA